MLAQTEADVRQQNRLHGLFHRVQPELGFMQGNSDRFNEHIDALEARVLIARMACLRRAIESSGSDRAEAIADARPSGANLGGIVRIHSTVLVFVALTASGTLAAGDGSTSAPTLTADQKPVPHNLRGVWQVSEQSIRSIGGAWSISTVPYLSLYIFTEKHYSYMFAPGSGPRRLFAGNPNRPTEAEKVAAYDSFVAGSGTYELSGSRLTLKAILHKNPNEMKGEPLAYNVELDGSKLVLTIVNPPFAPDQERRTVLTRLE